MTHGRRSPWHPPRLHGPPWQRALGPVLFASALLLAVSSLRAGADDPPPVPAPALAAAPAPAPASTPPARAYLDSAGVRARLTALAASPAAKGPAVMLTEYGQSAGGQVLQALWVGAPDKPLVLVHGGLAANDAAGSVAVLALAERLLAPEAAAVLERVSFVLLPAPSPDALDAFLAGRPRAGGVALDRDQDGRRGEDGPDDLDGDGQVLRMRRRTPRGTWAAGDEVGKRPGQPDGPEADARRLVPAGVDARRAASYELLEEGRDDDGDGAVNEDAPGMDLTRQLAGWWDAQGPWGGEGGYAGQAPETRALMELSYGLPSLLAWYGFRSEGPWLLRASEHGALADADQALYDKRAGPLKLRTGLDLRKASELAGGPNPGSDLDWAAAQLGLSAFAVPVWRIAKEEAYKAERPVADETDWLLWSDRLLGGQAFRAWAPFQHPTLGPVEIGGWRRFTRHEPPAAFLSAAVESVCAAPLVEAEFAPRLALQVAVEDEGGGLFDVRAAVLNVGGGPTDTALARARRRDMPVRLTLTLEDGVERVGGPATADLGTVEAGAASAEVRWVLRRIAPRVNRQPEPLLGALTARHRVAGRVTEEVKVR